MNFTPTLAIAGLSVLLSWTSPALAKPCQDAEKPNVVIILADDLGYGDVQQNNPDSTIPTPSFQRLATEGVNFVDAHSGSAVCTPTRYGLVCGRYCWRTTLKRGVLGGYSKPLIAQDQQTIGQIVKQAGYHASCIGKWHLGLGWQWKQDLPENINNFGVAGEKGMVDYQAPITDGPLQHGFDECYIIPASLDMSPYVFIKNDRATEIPADQLIAGSPFPAFFRKGEIGPKFQHIDCLGHLTQQACQYIRRRAETKQPFLLYFPMPAPHKPVIPAKEFQGTSGLGPYGDFIKQVDHAVGTVLTAIDDAGIADNTLVIVTSDNGSFMHRYDDPNKKDHVDDSSIQGFRADRHRANGPLRGTKADVWEAGHRVPFFCRWPKRVAAGAKVDWTICHTDILATVAEATGAEFDREASEDSFSFLSVASSPSSEFVRPPVIHHSVSGMFAIRDGKWKLVMGNGSGGREKPSGKPFGKPFRLFDMTQDLAEAKDVIGDYPDVAKRLEQQFEALAHGDQK